MPETVYAVVLNSYVESLHASSLGAQAGLDAIRTSEKFKGEDWRVNGNGIWASAGVKSLRVRPMAVEA